MKKKVVCWLIIKAPDVLDLLQYTKNILVVFFDGAVRLNPLEVIPGMKANDNSNIFADIFVQATRLYDGTKNFIVEHLNRLYEKYAGLGYYPSLFDFYYYIKAMKFSQLSRTARYQESAVNRVGGMISGSGKIFDCSRGHIKSLADTHTIFMIQHFTAEMQVFIVNWLLTWLFYFKLTYKSDVEHVIGIDDSNLLFDVSFERRPDLGMPILHHLLSNVRKAGITIIVTSQAPTMLGSSIFSNLYVTVMMALSDGGDIEKMQRTMGITNPEEKDCCHKIKDREAIVKLAGRYLNPFVITIPDKEEWKNLGWIS